MGDDSERGGGRKYRISDPKLRRGFVAFPKHVLYDADLSAGARVVYGLLVDLAWRSGGEPPDPELGEVAELLGTAEKTVRAYIRELVGAGLVESVRRGQGRSNAYVVHVGSAPPTSAQRDGLNGKKDRSRTAESTDPMNKEPLDEEPPTGANAPVPAGPPALVKINGRNLGFDALAEACEVDVRNRKRSGELAAALKDVRRYAWDEAVAETGGGGHLAPEQFERLLAGKIERKAKLYRARMDGAALTPSALAKWWHDVERVDMRRRGLAPGRLAALSDEEVAAADPFATPGAGKTHDAEGQVLAEEDG